MRIGSMSDHAKESEKCVYGRRTYHLSRNIKEKREFIKV